MITNGQRVPTTGWFIDNHGHMLFLNSKQYAPLCPRLGLGTVTWRLLRRV